MKILLLNYEFPPLGGGAGNATRAIARSLVKKGHEVTVVTTWFEGLKDIDTTEGFTLYRIHSARKQMDRSNTFEMVSFIFKTIFFLKKHCQKSRYDFSIAFFALPTGLLSLYVKKKFKIPYILSLRGGDVPGFLPNDLGLLHTLSSPFTTMVWRNSDGIVANSVGLQELANKTASQFRKKVLYIPNGVDTSLYFSENRKIHDTVKMLFVGRFVPQKRIDVVLRAFSHALAHSVNKKISLTLVGDGPLFEKMKQCAKNEHIDSFVQFLGWLSKEEVARLYRENDILLLPSYEEGMPNVVLEAMASGLAIVASDITGTNELVRDRYNGCLVQNEDEYGQVLVDLVKDTELLETYKQHSRERSLTFDWDSVAEKYLTVL